MRIATYNVNFNDTTWEERGAGIARQLKCHDLDVVCLQEVDAAKAIYLMEELGMEHAFFKARTQPDKHGVVHGLATLSRVPFQETALFDFEEDSQGRICTVVTLEIEGQQYAICNGHYHWQKGWSSVRYQQVKEMLRWMEDFKPAARIILGDFNETPKDSAIQLVKKYYPSAFEARHGEEPNWTCDSGSYPKNWWQELKAELGLSWKGTLDYIFFENKKLYPEYCYTTGGITDSGIPFSDHRGIVAEFSALPTSD